MKNVFKSAFALGAVILTVGASGWAATTTPTTIDFGKVNQSIKQALAPVLVENKDFLTDLSIAINPDKTNLANWTIGATASVTANKSRWTAEPTTLTTSLNYSATKADQGDTTTDLQVEANLRTNTLTFIQYLSGMELQDENCGTAVATKPLAKATCDFMSQLRSAPQLSDVSTIVVANIENLKKVVKENFKTIEDAQKILDVLNGIQVKEADNGFEIDFLLPAASEIYITGLKATFTNSSLVVHTGFSFNMKAETLKNLFAQGEQFFIALEKQDPNSLKSITSTARTYVDIAKSLILGQ